MASPEATQQLPSAETNKKPLEELSREDLRVLVNETYGYSSETGGDDLDLDAMMEDQDDRITLASLELMAFDKAADDTAENNEAVIKAVGELRGEQGDKDTIKAYLDQLYAALHKGDRTAESEVEARFEKDLDAKRSALAGATYKGINGLLSHKSEKNQAQERYDESLRLWGRFTLHGEDDQAEAAGDILLDEMERLRGDMDKLHQRETTPSEEKTFLQKGKGWLSRKADKGYDIELPKGKKIRLTAGKFASAIAATAAGAGAGLVFRVGLDATMGLVGIPAAVVAGALTGGIISGYRAHKNIKRGLLDTAASDEDALKAHLEVAGTDNLDTILRTHLSSEATKAKKERGSEVRQRVVRGMGRGAVSGLVGGVVGYAVGPLGNLGEVLSNAAEASDEVTDKIGEGVGYIQDQFGDNSPDAESGETSVEADAGTTDSSHDDVFDPSDTDAPVAEASTEELLQHYTGENTITIGESEGPYETFQTLGIPESQWESLFNNEQLMDQLVANGDAYSLNDAGIQENGFGWLGNELSPDSAQAIYEAAGMDSIDTAVDTTPVDTNLPESYQELPPEVQEFAQQKYDVVMNIESGMGGEKLMEALNADPQVWYNFEYDLLQAAPNDFYLMNDGHVGISHTGALSPEAIEALAKGLSQNNALAA